MWVRVPPPPPNLAAVVEVVARDTQALQVAVQAALSRVGTKETV